MTRAQTERGIPSTSASKAPCRVAVPPGITSARGAALVEVFRASLAALEPAEQDAIVSAIVADLRARRSVAVAPLGGLGPPTEPIADPRSRL